VSIALALVVTAAGLVELLTRSGVSVGYRDDGPLLITLTVAGGLSLALLWWSPLAGLCVSLGLLCAQSIIGYQFTLAALWAVVVASLRRSPSTTGAARWRPASWWPPAWSWRC